MASPSPTVPPSVSPRQPARLPPDPERWELPLALLLAFLLGGFWLWHSATESAAHTVVDYSVFHGWVEADKVALVVMDGAAVDFQLKEQEAAGGRVTRAFRTARPEGDEGLLPLLLEKKVQIRVTLAEQSEARQWLFAVLPWMLIIGGFIWLSRRTQKMMLPGGGAVGGILKHKSRKYEKEIGRAHV